MVTGATGFVGKCLCNHIEQKTDFQLRRILRSSSSPSTDRIENFQIVDLALENDWSKMMKDVDFVVHLAARTHNMGDKGMDNLELYEKANVQSTLNLAKAAQSAGVKKFIYLSSVKAVGESNAFNHNKEPIVWNEATAAAPLDAYGVTKRKSEQLLLEMKGRMQVVIFRPPLIYGPGVKANFLKLIKLVQKKIPIPISTLPNRRSIVFVENLVDAIVHCIKDTSVKKNDVYFIADEPALSTSELALEIGKSLKARVFLIKIPHVLFETMGKITGKTNIVKRLTESLAIDSSKYRKEYHWQPPFEISQGLERTIAWLKLLHPKS